MHMYTYICIYIYNINLEKIGGNEESMNQIFFFVSLKSWEICNSLLVYNHSFFCKNISHRKIIDHQSMMFFSENLDKTYKKNEHSVRLTLFRKSKKSIRILYCILIRLYTIVHIFF